MPMQSYTSGILSIIPHPVNTDWERPSAVSCYGHSNCPTVIFYKPQTPRKGMLVNNYNNYYNYNKTKGLTKHMIENDTLENKHTHLFYMSDKINPSAPGGFHVKIKSIVKPGRS